MHCTTRSVLTSFLRPSVIQSSALPSFLVPSISLTQVSSFSNTPSHNARKDRNPNRGISALRRTGLRKRQTLSVKLEDLPKPVLDPERRSKVQTNPEHGLNDFFNQEAETPGLMTPRELKSHGRGWTVLELRRKDWDDIWRLWWVCVKERNRIMTFLEERQRMGGQIDGASEAMGRMKEVSLITFDLDGVGWECMLTTVHDVDQEDNESYQAHANRAMVCMGQCAVCGNGG